MPLLVGGLQTHSTHNFGVCFPVPSLSGNTNQNYNANHAFIKTCLWTRKGHGGLSMYDMVLVLYHYICIYDFYELC